MDSNTKAPIIPCTRCGGDGREWKSRYGGNDPDVWDAGPCKHCDGSGNAVCENCGEVPATEPHIEGVSTFLLCRPCLDEWLEDDNA